MDLYWLGLIGAYLHTAQQRESYRALTVPEKMEIVADEGTYQCACCLHTQPGDGFHDICGICNWECDSWDLDAEYGPNHMTLREGRANYAKHGDSDEHCSHGVRSRGCNLWHDGQMPEWAWGLEPWVRH